MNKLTLTVATLTYYLLFYSPPKESAFFVQILKKAETGSVTEIEMDTKVLKY
jgi:hypothetical protein